MREHIFGSGRWVRSSSRGSSNCVGVKMVRLLLILFSMVHGLSLPAFTLGSTRSEVSNDLSGNGFFDSLEHGVVVRPNKLTVLLM